MGRRLECCRAESTSHSQVPSVEPPSTIMNLVRRRNLPEQAGNEPGDLIDLIEDGWQ